MAIPIRPDALPAVPGGTVDPASALIIDDGAGVWKATPQEIADATTVPASLAARPTSATLAASGGAALIGFLQTGTSPATETVQAKLRRRIDLLDKAGADNTGATANDTALATALTDAYSNYNKPIDLVSGIYKFTGTQTITQGVPLFGEGGQGSTETYSTVLKQYSASDFIKYNGAGAAASGTGGGLRDFLIAKADTFQGGTAITLLATSSIPEHRPGEMILSNILILGVGSTAGPGGPGGLWERGLVIDGTACNTPGGRGVRSIHGYKIRVADCTVSGESVVINQATHLFLTGLQIDAGDATGVTPGVTIKGINDNVNFLGIDNNGSVAINVGDATTPTVTGLTMIGSIGATFINNDTISYGNVILGMTPGSVAGFVLINKSPNLSMRTPINPAFQISLAAATANNKTGDATVYAIGFDTENFDRGNNFALPSGAYVCRCAGLHRFRAQVTLANLPAGSSDATISLVRTVGSTTTITKAVQVTPNTGNFATLEVSGSFWLAYDDQVSVAVSVSGGAKTVGVYGSATTTIYTAFEGEYLG